VCEVLDIQEHFLCLGTADVLWAQVGFCVMEILYIMWCNDLKLRFSTLSLAIFIDCFVNIFS